MKRFFGMTSLALGYDGQPTRACRRMKPESNAPAPSARLATSSRAELHRQRERAEAMGAELVLDRIDDPGQPLFVFADLSGHPFCIFVA